MPREFDPLRERWNHLCARLAPAGEGVDSVAVAEAFEDLRRRLTRRDRHYHNLTHVAACLDELDHARAEAVDVDAVEAALWFHDAVYGPRRRDNERRSAEMAASFLHSIGVPPARVDVARELVLATAHSGAPAPGDASLMVDIDLSILGRPVPEFDRYERAIRREYAFVPDADFRAGRSAVLRAFLERGRIYSTDPFFLRYEASARSNLSRSLAALSG